MSQLSPTPLIPDCVIDDANHWLSAQEIADLALPDLPNTRRGVAFYAAQEGWDDNPALARMREGRGGGVEYHIRLLPRLAQLALAAQRAERQKGAPTMIDPDANLAEPAKLMRDAKLLVMKAFDRFCGLARVRKTKSLHMFATAYNSGELCVDGWVREQLPQLSARSLQRWLKLRKDGRLDALGVDRAAARKGKSLLERANDGMVQAHILALIAHQPHLSAEHVRTLCRAEFGDSLNLDGKAVDMPPVRTFQNALKRLKASHKAALLKLTNPDLYRSTMAPSGVGIYRDIKEPNVLWQIDASPVDALCEDGRHSLYCCLDIATRRMVITLSKTPRASAVALLLRKAIQAWGVPDAIKTDNGSDFVARDTKRLLASLDIEMIVSDAYQPQQKGHVERAIRTFQHDVGPLLPGFVGHSVADRKAIESRKSFANRLGASDAELFSASLSAAQMQHFIDEWVAQKYEHKVHSGLGMSPAQAATQSKKAVRMVDERALDLLLMPVAGKDGLRTTTKFGIRIQHRFYQTPDILPGEQVLVRHDPVDLGRVYAFSADGGAFLGVGICPEFSGLRPEDVTRATKELQAAKIREATDQIRKDMARIAKGPALIEKALEVAARDVPNVVALPKRQEPHSTAQIDAAREAGRGPQLVVSADADLIAAQRRLIDEMAAEEKPKPCKADVVAQPERPSNVSRLPESPKDRYRRAVMVRMALEAGKASASDAHWLAQYETTPEFMAHQKLHEDFGADYLG